MKRRTSVEITIAIFDKIDESGGKLSKFGLWKVVGNTQMADTYRLGLIKREYLKESEEGRTTYLTKTEAGETLHKVLKDQSLFRDIILLSKRKPRLLRYI